MMTEEHATAHVQALRQELIELALDGVKADGDLDAGTEALMHLSALDRLFSFLVRKS